LALTLLRGVGKALKGSERQRNLFHPINKPIDNRCYEQRNFALLEQNNFAQLRLTGLAN